MLLFRIIHRLYRRIENRRVAKIFGGIGSLTRVGKLLRIQGGENIFLGDNVTIHERCWLAAKPLTGNHKATLSISDGCVLGDYNHIWATKKIVLERYVLTANHVYISDNLHGYEDIERPIVQQPIVQLNEVVIGEGSWIGENVCILGASVGKHCVIGANAVVTKNIPDYSVAVGIPAKVIKQFNWKTKQWEIIK